MGADEVLLIGNAGDGVPAPLVAAWLLDRLGNVAGIEVRVLDLSTVGVELDTATGADGVADAVTTLLHEPRFAGWSLNSSVP